METVDCLQLQYYLLTLTLSSRPLRILCVRCGKKNPALTSILKNNKTHASRLTIHDPSLTPHDHLLFTTLVFVQLSCQGRPPSALNASKGTALERLRRAASRNVRLCPSSRMA